MSDRGEEIGEAGKDGGRAIRRAKGRKADKQTGGTGELSGFPTLNTEPMAIPPLGITLEKSDGRIIACRDLESNTQPSSHELFTLPLSYWVFGCQERDQLGSVFAILPCTTPFLERREREREREYKLVWCSQAGTDRQTCS